MRLLTSVHSQLEKLALSSRLNLAVVVVQVIILEMGWRQQRRLDEAREALDGATIVVLIAS